MPLAALAWLKGLLTSRLAGPILGVASLGLLIFLAALKLQIHSLHTEIGHVRDQLAVTQRDLAQARTNEATLQGGIERQNAAISAMRAAGEAREAELSRIASSARTDAQTAQSRADAILHRPRTGNDCADAAAEIEEAIR